MRGGGASIDGPGPSTGAFVAAIFIGGLGVSQIVAMPLLAPLTASAHGIEGADSGLVGLFNLLGTAAGSLSVTVFLPRLSFRWAAILAAILSSVSQFSVAWGPDFNWALVMEALAGFGAGILLALSAAIVGASEKVDRGFAFMLTLQALIAILVLLVLPVLAMEEGLFNIVMFMAGLQALMIPLGLGLGGSPIRLDIPDLSATRQTPLRPVLFLRAGAYFLFSAAVGVVWVFSGILAVSAGLSGGAIGLALAVGNIAAIAGSLLAALIAGRFGRKGPVAVAALMVVLSVAMFSAEMGLGEFYMASCLFLFAWGGGLPLMMGAVADADPAERVTSLLPVLSFAGMGIGPALVSLEFGPASLFRRVWMTTDFLVFVALVLFCMAPLVSKRAAMRRQVRNN